MNGRTALLKAVLSALHYSGADSAMAPLTRGIGAVFMLHHVRPEHPSPFEPNRILKVTPQFLEEVIRQVRRAVGDSVVLGAGTVLDPETARAALLAGAEYIVAPTLNLDVIRLCRRYDKAVMPGAFTPTEVLTAWEAGADVTGDAVTG